MKYTWITMLVVGLTVVMLVAKSLGVLTHTQIPMANAMVALTNTTPDVGAIDVYVDHRLVLRHLARTDPPDYLQVTPGFHLIDVAPAGENIVLPKSTELAFQAGHIYYRTYAVEGRPYQG